VADAAGRALTKIWLFRLAMLIFIWIGIEIFLPGLAAVFHDLIGRLLFGP
jgi:hypothetical protein